jgi:hypothetical protein
MDETEFQVPLANPDKMVSLCYALYTFLCCMFDFALLVCVLCSMPNVTCVYDLSHADVSVLLILFVVCVVRLTLLCLSSFFVLCPNLPVSTTGHTLMCLCCSSCLLSVLYVACDNS